MMINKRLIGTVTGIKKYIALNVLLQWCRLMINIAMIVSIATLLEKVFLQTADQAVVLRTAVIALGAVLCGFLCTAGAARTSYLSSKTMKGTLRNMIYEKLLRLGASYSGQVKTSEVVQVAVEGVDQLENYFGAYLPQFFYSLLAPLTLFAVLSFVSLSSAVVLLLCVPLIPVSIAVVQTFAKKMLAQYWGQYTTLGDTFLENLQGLTTLKIYQADEYKHHEMNRESEKFRKITMRVLSTQLNSVTVMDIIAYGGAALGIIISILQFQGGYVSLAGCVTVILLSAEFFIPMRLLGSYFHVAMNGMAASDKIFQLLDLPESQIKSGSVIPSMENIICLDLHFGYKEGWEVLHGVDFMFRKGSFTAVVGESGCGKSTIANILMGRNKGYTGSVAINDTELSDINEESLMSFATYVSYNSYLFKGTVRDNLLMGNPSAGAELLWNMLERVNLADFLRKEQGLDTRLSEKADNLSGGQRQRLALARALLRDSPVYMFDEATSNIDVESENEIMEQIYALSKRKTVILITHRLANAVGADRIYVMEHGRVSEMGTHEELLEGDKVYASMWKQQRTLECYTAEGVA